MTTVPMIMAEVVVAIVVVRTAIDMGKGQYLWDPFLLG
jgi:hypothetical protein